MSTVRADNFGNRAGTSSISADTMLQGTAKAWFNLNGTGTIAARDSFNISSFTDNGAGDYTAAFTVAMPNANYGFAGSGRVNASSNAAAATRGVNMFTPTTANVQFVCQVGTASANDFDTVCGTVLGDPA